MKHPHSSTTAVRAISNPHLVGRQRPARSVAVVVALRALRAAMAGARNARNRLAAAAARAEQRVTEQFKVPPGGG
nr:hypothetical protein [uncultured Acidovorax sp.]